MICCAALGSGRRLATVSIAMPHCPLSLQYARAALQKEMYSTAFLTVVSICVLFLVYLLVHESSC